MAERRLKRPRDPIQLGKLIVDIATGQVEDRVEDGGDSAAVELGIVIVASRALGTGRRAERTSAAATGEKCCEGCLPAGCRTARRDRAPPALQ